MLSNDLLDIDSVNVLKGPQGTLYGFNTSAGAIDIRTRKPTFAPEYSLEQSVGQRGYVQSKLMASGALTDTLAGRINLSHTEKGGYVDNVLTGNKLSGNRSNGVRGQLLWQPTDNLDMRFIGDYSETPALVMSLVDTMRWNGKDTFLSRASQVGATVIKGRKVALDDESNPCNAGRYITDCRPSPQQRLHAAFAHHGATSVIANCRWFKYSTVCQQRRGCA
jgi:iron complex outermembrane receptor protein